MTSSRAKKGPSSFSFQRELPSPEHVLERIKTLTGELDALQAEIYGQIADPAELLDRRSELDQAGAAAVLENFKTALDHLRSILWFCESGSSTSHHDNVRTDRERELARANELLKALSPAAFTASSQAESGSFFERLDRVIDNYMQPGVSSKVGHARRSKA
jgi:hypothetical protein